MNDERARRVGLNEAIFRQVNEQIRGLNREFGAEHGTMTAICECGHWVLRLRAVSPCQRWSEGKRRR